MLRRFAAVLLLAALPCGARADKPGRTIEFNRDVRPILSNNCFVCHGPDNNLRKARLRLDQEQKAGKIHGGASVIVAGKPAESELYRRLISADPQEKMPPAKTNKHLTKQEIETIRLWIAQGGRYQKHWSLLAVEKRPAPAVKNAAWVRNPIDAFVLARLEAEGVRPAPPADRRTLIRRLSFDLIGLPPTPAEVDAFCADTSPQAYEKVVDRLLASKHYSERMALYWLDVVRYADSGGYHSDNERSVWMYRDWVIDAFNKNMPFDQFTLWQLAGDLLPRATTAQKVASGYNRLLQTTEEGGSQPKEYIAKYQADRVRNFSTAWLGLTLGCTECHDHKYDPFTTKEFYQLGAFFADVQEAAVGRQAPTRLPTPEQEAQLRVFDATLKRLQQELARPVNLDAEQAQWETKAKGTKGLPREIAAALAVESAKRTPLQKAALAKHYRGIAPALVKLRRELDGVQKQKAALLKNVPSTLITTAGPPRTVRVLARGNWLDDTGAIVLPATPTALPPLTVAPGKKRADRLDLARWLTAPENPLTARVFVNRLWLLTFGQALARPLDDLGAQGSWPTHPELLDWLAVDFRMHGWDIKRALKQIVMSSTYRQSSQIRPDLKGRDPYNTLLARQGRHRLEAELIRDNALSISGLLVPQIGGPSVKPYQPDGYWAYLNFPVRRWQKDTGPNQYRRGLYTFWQRTFLHPSLLAFDATTREECTVERPRSNTPQQALVLLNDPTYVEASRVFAEKIMRGGQDVPGRVQFAFRAALQRPATAAEVRILTGLYEQQRTHYRAAPKDAEALLRVGDRPVAAGLDRADLAAWTNVARTILNLHETITRQ